MSPLSYTTPLSSVDAVEESSSIVLEEGSAGLLQPDKIPRQRAALSRIPQTLFIELTIPFHGKIPLEGFRRYFASHNYFSYK